MEREGGFVDAREGREGESDEGDGEGVGCRSRGSWIWR